MHLNDEPDQGYSIDQLVNGVIHIENQYEQYAQKDTDQSFDNSMLMDQSRSFFQDVKPKFNIDKNNEK